MTTRLDRPDSKFWKPVANSDDSDRTESYQRAAKRLGIEIKISYPVPCSAGADLAAQTGHSGIYIKREQALRESELTSTMFDELKLMSR